MGIIAVGSIAIDSIASPKGEREGLLGGSLSHFATAASYLTKPKLISVVGKDFSNEYWDYLAERAIILGVRVDFNGDTFRWKGYYTEDYGDVNTVSTELNVFKDFKPSVLPIYKKSRNDILFLANIDPELQKSVLNELKNLPLKVLDTMDYWIENRREGVEELLTMVDGIILNKKEILLITGDKELFSAIEKLKSYNLKFIVVKRGEGGALLFYGDEVVALPAYPVRDIVDPTGAGDSFAGAFLSYLDREGAGRLTLSKLKKAMAYGVVVSSFVVEDFGVYGLSHRSYNEIRQRLKLYRNMLRI